MSSLAARDGGLKSDASSVDSEGVLELGNISLDLATFNAAVGPHKVSLTYQEFELLRCLVDAGNRVVSFDVLSGLLWGSSGPRQTRRLNVLVCRLRNKLRDAFPHRLETVRGRGYGLLAAGEGGPAQGRGGSERD